MDINELLDDHMNGEDINELLDDLEAQNSPRSR